MRAKDYFRRASNAERDLRRLEALRDHYDSVGKSITAQWGGTGGGAHNNASKVEMAAVGIADSELDFMAELARYRAIVNEAENVITRIQQARFRQILTLHYLAGLALTDVADRLGYKDRDSVYRAHGWALLEAQKIIDKLDE